MMLDARKLDRRVTLHQAGIVTDAGGDAVPGFTPLQTVWASVRPAPGIERLQSGENAASAPKIITIRWSAALSALSARDRVEYPVGVMLDIKSVDEIGRRDGLQIVAVGAA